MWAPEPAACIGILAQLFTTCETLGKLPPSLCCFLIYKIGIIKYRPHDQLGAIT